MASFTVHGLDQTAKTLFSGQFGFIGQTGELIVDTGDAVTGSGANDLIVRGNITALSNANGDSAYDFNGTFVDLFVDATGSIISTGGNAVNIVATSTVDITNDGRIMSDGTAIVTTHSDGSATNRIVNNGFIFGLSGVVFNSGLGGTDVVNTGVISSQNIALQSPASGNARLTNSGTIASASSISVLMGSGNDVVLNTGTIIGRLSLGSGDDLYDGQQGELLHDTFHLLGLGNDTFLGGDGADRVSGETDSDEIHTGGGNDTIRGNDDLVEDLYDGGAGFDHVDYSGSNIGLSVNLVIGMATGGFIGLDRLVSIESVLTGFGDDTIIGNAEDNLIRAGDGDDRASGGDGVDRLRGDLGDDTLRGDGGNDRLFGEEDNDRLFGGDGNDLLIGGLGRDLMTGDAGGDFFAFVDIADSGTAAGTLDRITDFQQGSDKIDLSAIDANPGTSQDDAFAFIGTAGFSGTAGEVRFRQGATLTLVDVDQDGDGVADMSVRLDGVINLVAGDFIL